MPESVPTYRRFRPALVALGMAMAIAVFASFSSRLALDKLRTLTDERAQVWQGRFQLVELRSMLTDLESGARGFALTGDPHFLEPYENALWRLPVEYALTKQVLSGHRPGEHSWAALDQLIEQRITVARMLVDVRRRYGASVIEYQDLLAAGNRATDEIRSAIADLDGEQSRMIEARSRLVDEIDQRSKGFEWLSTVSIVALIVGSALLLFSEWSARRRLEQQILDANRHLEQRVEERTRELSEARQRIADFAVEQERLVEAERRRISREVHDQIGAVFTGIKLLLRGLPQGSLPGDAERALLDALDMGVVTARRIAAELRPPLIDDLGLQAALEQMLESRVGDHALGFAVLLKEAERLDSRQAMGVFRIVQEASTNVLRHSGATHFVVQGEPLEDRFYQIKMMDDGIGMGGDAPRPEGLGIAGMRERAGLLGGELTIANQLQGGAMLTLRLPLYRRDGKNADENPAA